MLATPEQQVAFCREFNISIDMLRRSRLTWNELNQIAEDFSNNRNEYQNTVKKYAEVLQKCSGVHSLNSRVKDTMHLIAKIIRKNPEYLERGDSLTKDNYLYKITDLMGIRILLLFKEDWLSVHEYILQHYQQILAEPPFAHVRDGDDTSLYKEKIAIKNNKPYRSVHYVIRTEQGLGVEIQVRTLYEEAWSEIDHKLRYPYNLQNIMLTNYVNLMNRLTGMGDEMGTFIHSYIKQFQESLQSGVTNDNEVYQFILHELENCNDEKVKQAITDKIRHAGNYKEMKKMSELLKSLLEDT